MKVIGRSEIGYIATITREELEALYPQAYYQRGVALGTEVDVIMRLRPTVKFEQDSASGPQMVAHLREMADELEKGFSALRS